MNLKSKILITGSQGMVGQALAKKLTILGYENIFECNRSIVDLTNYNDTINYFKDVKPDYTFLLAAKVGGIAANIADPVGFLLDNIKIQNNSLEACSIVRPIKNLFLGSSCIYPKECLQPMKEEYLLTGELETTNEGYALAKIMGIRLAQYYFKKIAMQTILPMPSNIYGTNDHFDLDKSHVLSALVKRFVDAREMNAKQITLWGTGIAKREFIHVDDVADALIFLMINYDSNDIINLGTGMDVSIFDLASMIKKFTDYPGEILWDRSKPNGMLKKCMDINKLNKLGFRSKVDLETGIRRTIEEYEMIRREL